MMKKIKKFWKTKHNPFFVSLSALTTLFVVFFVVLLVSSNVPVKEAPPAVLTFDQEPFETLDIGAQAIAVFDINNDVFIYEQNIDESMPLASLTKLMTALVVLDYADENDSISISADALLQEGNNFLKEGETWKIEDLVEYMLVTSSNDAANQFARSIAVNESIGINSFIEAMNGKAHTLGLSSLSFINESGLDVVPGVPSAFGSAKDIAKLFAYALDRYPDIFSASGSDGDAYLSLDRLRHIGINTNVVANKLPLLVASKTGYTDGAGGNLAFVFELGPARPVVVVILGSTFNGRFDDAEEIARATVKSLQSN